MNALYQIIHNQLCFGIETGTKLVIATAPCCRWALGRNKITVLSYWKKRGAMIIKVW
jgi:hypothetical protein